MININGRPIEFLGRAETARPHPLGVLATLIALNRTRIELLDLAPAPLRRWRRTKVASAIRLH